MLLKRSIDVNLHFTYALFPTICVLQKVTNSEPEFCFGNRKNIQCYKNICLRYPTFKKKKSFDLVPIIFDSFFPKRT